MLGKDYKPSLLCKYSDHPTNSNGKTIKVSWTLYNFVKSLDRNFILGSLICQICQKKLNLMRGDEPMDCDEDDIDADPDFVPATPFLDDAEKLNRKTELDCLTESLGTKNIRFQVASNINNMSPISHDYLGRMHKNIQNNLTEKFCNLVAPGQEQEMKRILECKQENPGGIDPVVKNLKEAFDMLQYSNSQTWCSYVGPKILQ